MVTSTTKIQWKNVRLLAKRDKQFDDIKYEPPRSRKESKEWN